MPKKPVQIQVVQEGDERYIIRTFADGTKERVPVVKRPSKPARWPYRKLSLDKSRKKGFKNRLPAARRAAFSAIGRLFP
jgi:hypothetical protein